MKSRSGFVKRAIIVTAMAVLLPVSAAYGADYDWQTNVNGYPIQCKLTELDKWLFFHLKYTFCDGNYWDLSCSNIPVDIFNNGDVRCSLFLGQATQACNGATYRMSLTKKEFRLNAGTIGAQKYVCEEQFKLMNVSVTPLK